MWRWQTKFARGVYFDRMREAAQIRENVIAGEWWCLGELRRVEIRHAVELVKRAAQIRKIRFVGEDFSRGGA